MDSTSRREFLSRSARIATTLAASGAVTAGEAEATELPGEIAALFPRDSRGHQFVVYADCCSGVAGAPNEKSHALVNAVVSRIRPRPEFIAFPGDAVMGYVADGDLLRRQWRHWQEVEMAWLKGTGVPLYQSTSNHNTYDEQSEQIFREFHTELPQNGKGNQTGLAYAVRRGDLLYVSTHQPDRTRPYRREMTIDTEWLDAVLNEHRDARFKFVCGHYPVFPVNGYSQYPLWCFRPDERRPFWDVLVRHRVNAYFGSHILAFDVQAHEGILQIVTGGAGTQGSGPLALMPSRSEYLHAMQVAVDELGLRYRLLGTEGTARESLVWPFVLPSAGTWKRIPKSDVSSVLAPREMSQAIVAWRFQGEYTGAPSSGLPQTLLCGWDSMEGVATVWIGLTGTPQRLTVRLVPQSGFGWQTWTGAELPAGRPFDFQVALHSGMGPGGILFRHNDEAPWQSLSSSSSKGTEDLTWPRTWTIGEGQSGLADEPFVGTNLSVDFGRAAVPAIA